MREEKTSWLTFGFLKAKEILEKTKREICVFCRGFRFSSFLSLGFHRQVGEGVKKEYRCPILGKLDNNGTLGKLIESGNWTALRQSMDLFLPVGVFYNLTVYDENMQRVNTKEVSNSNKEGQRQL